jgi:hypothetical protein
LPLTEDVPFLPQAVKAGRLPGLEVLSVGHHRLLTEGGAVALAEALAEGAPMLTCLKMNACAGLTDPIREKVRTVISRGGAFTGVVEFDGEEEDEEDCDEEEYHSEEDGDEDEDEEGEDDDEDSYEDGHSYNEYGSENDYSQSSEDSEDGDDSDGGDY